MSLQTSKAISKLGFLPLELVSETRINAIFGSRIHQRIALGAGGWGLGVPEAAGGGPPSPFQSLKINTGTLIYAWIDAGLIDNAGPT